ncbi:hypothetical protein AVEN_126679-1 [Araneus ventricosus]|uniref:Uncharacterized protein n=1 Tax=Araneus ventricosus TaxID=182803 RepID=A0A4Y2VZX9_ARAVE|nr:hypothetical protein AVEN_266991-1 [Araneus ventricosus]GBO29888.1 hypothetical protein AVEN_126679-1 [Araneus ventricosus]
MDKRLKIAASVQDEKNEDDGPTYNKLRKIVDESNDTVSTSKNMKRNVLSNKKLKKYQEDFSKYGFIYCVVNGEEHQLCVNYRDKLANKIMKPAKFKRRRKSSIKS